MDDTIFNLPITVESLGHDPAEGTDTWRAALNDADDPTAMPLAEATGPTARQAVLNLIGSIELPPIDV